MMNSISVSHDQTKEIFKAMNGIGELLKRLPSKPEYAPLKYAIMSNLTVIQMSLTGMPRASSNCTLRDRHPFPRRHVDAIRRAFDVSASYVGCSEMLPAGAVVGANLGSLDGWRGLWTDRKLAPKRA
jgi:hypothetical protein